MLNHFLQFSTDEFRGTANDIFKLCMKNSGYQKKDFLPGYICTSLEEAKQLVLSVTRSASSSAGKGCELEHAVGHVFQHSSVEDVLHVWPLSLGRFLSVLQHY